MKNINLSIIITSYKRVQKIRRIISELIDQIPKKYNSEIIISGNDNNYIEKNLSKFKTSNIKIRFIRNKKNSNALKRNTGIKKAKGKNIILLDDDCLPKKNFIYNYLNLFKTMTNQDIICGSVFYEKKFLKKNFVRYRQSRHFIINKENFKINRLLKPSKIVTMNMGFKNSKKISKTSYFNEKFGNYGFEDYEFGFRLIKLGFRLLPAYPSIIHLDERSFEYYLNKIYFLATHATPKLIEVNLDAWKNISYYRIEKNKVVNFFKKKKFSIKIINIIIKIILFLEKMPFLYLPKIYRFAILLSYCRGYYDRKLLIKYNKKWYR